MQIAQDREQQITAMELSNIELANVSRNKVMQKLPDWLHDKAEVFNKTKAERLPPHRSYNHEIEFIE